jgi:transposase-like protein
MDQLSYCRHRFPPVVIQHAIWLYLRFTLSYRDVEELSPSAAWRFPMRRCGAGF